MYRMSHIFLIPSFYAHVLNGLLLLFICILLYKYYPKIVALEPYKIIIILLLLSMSVGIHSLSHLGLEYSYGYNPVKIFTMKNREYLISE